MYHDEDGFACLLFFTFVVICCDGSWPEVFAILFILQSRHGHLVIVAGHDELGNCSCNIDITSDMNSNALYNTLPCPISLVIMQFSIVARMTLLLTRNSTFEPFRHQPALLNSIPLKSLAHLFRTCKITCLRQALLVVLQNFR